MTDSRPRSEKREQARSSLPDDLKPVFDELVADYQFAAIKRHGAKWVSYAVLVDLVRAGWGLAAEPVPARKEP